MAGYGCSEYDTGIYNFGWDFAHGLFGKHTDMTAKKIAQWTLI